MKVASMLVVLMALVPTNSVAQNDLYQGNAPMARDGGLGHRPMSISRGESPAFPLQVYRAHPSSSLISPNEEIGDSIYESWVARHEGLYNDLARDIVVDDSGNVYVTGVSGNATSLDYETIKYDPFGNEIWVAYYDGPGNLDDIAYDLAIDRSGNVYVTGSSMETMDDFVTVKYDASGNEQWIARYDGPGNEVDVAWALAVDDSGNVYVTGWSWGTSSLDYATIKYGSSGDEVWVERYNGPANGIEYAWDIALDGSGGVYVTGWSRGQYNEDFATIKYDASGNEQWIARYNGPGNSFDGANALAVDDLGNVYVTGYSVGTMSQTDYLTIKYDELGVEQWVSRYSGPGDESDEAYSVVVDGFGSVYVTGRSVNTSSDYTTVKYDSSGDELWAASYDGPGNHDDGAWSLAVDVLGNVYVTGNSSGSGTLSDYATIKYDPSGNEQWVARYNGPGNDQDIAWAIAVDGSGNVYVTGGSEGSGTFSDFATIKYLQPPSYVNDPGTLPTLFSLGQNYPNPFNSSTVIVWELPSRAQMRLEVFNVIGERVAMVVDGEREGGYHAIEFDAQNLPSGIYLYRIQAGAFADTKKLVLLK